MTAYDPLASIPDGSWRKLSDLTGERIVHVRGTLRVYLWALREIGLELKPAEETTVDWTKVAEEVGLVLGDVASDRDMGVKVSSKREISLVVEAVRSIVEP